MRTLKILVTVLFFMSLAALPSKAQDKRLLYTVLRGPGEALTNPCPGSLSHLDPNEVGVVTPQAAGIPDGLKFASMTAWNTIIGDHDLDSDYYEVLFKKIDAIQMRGGPANVNKDMHKLYFSLSETFVTSVPPAPATVRPADIVRILQGGDVEYFLLADDIAIAFGMNCGVVVDLNVDALAVLFPNDKDPGAIFLSFEETRQIAIGAGAYWVEDGAILCIPGTAILWNPDGTVGGVVPGSGQIVLMEVDVGLSTDLVVDHSMVNDFNGIHPTAIGDCDGLAIDKEMGGTFVSPWGVYHNLLISGETLTGGGVISTAMNGAGLYGSIAQVNGAALASPAPNFTTGVQVGLTGNPVGSLNGLFTGSEYLLHYMIDSDYPEPPMPAVEVMIGHENFAGAHLLHVMLGPCLPYSPPGSIAPTMVYSNPCFPLFPMPILAGCDLFVPVAVPAGGCGNWVAPGAGLAGLTLVFQAIYPNPAGGFYLSTPATITP